MADAASHNKEMEDLMGAEVFMPVIEDRELQGIDNSSDGINNSTGQKPHKSRRRQGIDKLGKGEHAGPAHGDIYHGGEPFGTVNPEAGYNDTDKSKAPDQCKHDHSGTPSQGNEADGSISSGNQDIDHHVIKLFKPEVGLGGFSKGMVHCACDIQ